MLVELARYQTRVEADLARLRLAQEGIEAIPFDEGLNYVLGGLAMPIRLMVSDEDAEAALELLADEGL